MVNLFKPLVTCIVPIYNADKYLEQGIESLLNQSYENLEILLVDDHSTDASWKICQKYASKYENIIAVQTEENSGGPLAGRRLGIKKATGDWITFMDGDDYVKKNYIKHLIEGTNDGKYDISVTGYSLLYENGKTENFYWKNYSQSTVERLNEFYKHFICGDYHTDPADTVGQNLVRADIAKKTYLDSLPNNIYAEDTVMALSFLANSSKGVNFVDHHDFVWRQLTGSGSHGGFYTKANRDAFYDACNATFSRSDIEEVLNKDIGKISVIVPIYNVERYISKCIDSILGQTYANIEVILVDDNTPDTSGRIADRYARKDNRIKVIHKSKNEGLNMARATGFEACAGTYVMFVDGDDMIARDCVEFALRAIVKNKVEFAKFNVQTFKDESSLPESMNYKDEFSEGRVLSGKKNLYKSRFNNKIVGVSRVAVWGGLYPYGTVKEIDWKESNYRQHEDMYWTMQFLEKVDKGVFMSKVGYFYRVDESNRSVLSSSIVGNTFNDEPVGYLEFAQDYLKKLEYYNKKYNLEIDDEIDNFGTWQWVSRLSELLKAGMLASENNLEYLPMAINTIIGKYQNIQEKLNKQQDSLNRLHSERDELYDNKNALIHKLNELTEENKALKDELRSFMSVRSSVRLLIDNVKRKTGSMLKW